MAPGGAYPKGCHFGVKRRESHAILGEYMNMCQFGIVCFGTGYLIPPRPHISLMVAGAIFSSGVSVSAPPRSKATFGIPNTMEGWGQPLTVDIFA